MYSKKTALFKNTTVFIKNHEVISKIDVFYFIHEYTISNCRILKSWTDIGKINFYYFYPITDIVKNNDINTIKPIKKLTPIEYKEYIDKIYGGFN